MVGAPEARPAQPEVVRPCGEAWRCTKAALFPLDVGKWLTLGFVAWLAIFAPGREVLRLVHLMLKGNSPLRHLAWQRESPPAWELLDQYLTFVEGHLPLFLIGAIFGLALYLAAAYLRSRGVFMYLDCVGRQTAAVVEPWRNARKHALSYFCWQLAIDLVAGLIALTLAAAACVAVGRAPWRLQGLMAQPEFDLKTAAAFLLLAVALVIVLLAYLLLKWTLRNLVATLMYLRGISGRQAWGELLRLFLGNPGTVLLYLLMNVALDALYAALLLPACCCTCCIGVLPVISQAVMQPILYWIRAYPFFFLAQFGPEYRPPDGFSPRPGAAAFVAQPPRAVMNAPVPPEPPRVASCPQCGQPHQVPRGGQGTYVCAKCGARFEVS